MTVATSTEEQDVLSASISELLQTLPDEQQQQGVDLMTSLSEGATFGDIYGIDDEKLEAVYSVAHTMYENGKYDDAVSMFRFLSIMDYSEQRFWMGLGASHQMAGNYEDAVQAFGQATILDIDDPKPQLQAGYCLMQLKMHEAATEALEGVLMSVNLDAATKVQAEAMLTRIRNA